MLDKIIYPECNCCKRIVESVRFGLCDDCMAGIKVNFSNRCNLCSNPVPDGSNICGRCFSSKVYFDRGFFLFPYNDCGKALIHSIKFKDHPEYLKVIDLFKIQIFSFFDEIRPQVITYVPSSFNSFFKRGYSVPKRMAIMLSNLSGVELKRLVFTKKLFKKRLSLTKSVNERKKIVKRSFEVRAKGNYERILIVDDVFTTGSTINFISKRLKEKGIGERIYFLTLAMVLND